jgi:hypothetical protein
LRREVVKEDEQVKDCYLDSESLKRRMYNEDLVIDYLIQLKTQTFKTLFLSLIHMEIMLSMI